MTTVEPAQTRVPAARRRPVAVVQHLAQTPPPRPEFGHPLLAANIVLAGGTVINAFDVTPWWCAAGTTVAAVVAGTVTAAQAADRPEVVYVAGTTAAVGAWLTWVAATTPWSGISLGSLALGAITLGPVYGLLRWRRNRQNRRVIEARAKAREEHKRHTWTTILQQAGAPDIRIVGERTFAAGFALDLQLGPKSPDFRSLAGMTSAIERIAANHTKLPIRSGSIQIEPGELAHQATMVVPTRDVLSEDIHYPDRTEPRSIHDPLGIGQFIDGTEVPVVFRSVHGMVAGMNDAGKSGQLNVHIAELTRCVDNVTWYIAGNKAVRGLSPWLLPYLKGEVDRPVFDWIAGDLDEGMRMLLDAYRATDGRQAMFADGADKWEPTPDNPQITIEIDESPDLFASTRKFRTHKGEMVTFSELVLKLLRLARSEAIQIQFLSQRGTATMLGPDGGDLKSQIVYRLGFRATGNMVDVNAVFASDTVGITLNTLPNGAFYIEQKGYSRPRLAKGYRLKPDRIKQIAINNAQYCGAVDEATAALMPNYAGRWTRPNQRELLDTIAGRRTPTTNTDTDTAPVVGGDEVTDWTNPSWKLQPPQALIDAAEAADKARDESRRISEDAKNDPSIRNKFAAMTAELEQMMALPTISDDARNTTSSQQPDQPVDEDQADAEPPSADLLALLGALAASDLLYAAGSEWVPSDDIRTVAAQTLGWPDNSEGFRRIAAALREVHIEAGRPSIEGRKTTAYKVSDLRSAIQDHHHE